MRGRLGSAAAGLGLAIVLATCLTPAAATAKTGQMGNFGGVTVDGSPYRYAAFPPRAPGKQTTVARIERQGGRVSRWWALSGSFFVPALAADPDRGGGLSADGETLVLSGLWGTYPPRVSRFAVLKTQFNYEWHGPGRPPHFRQFPKFIDLPGTFTFASISPDGATVYLRHYLQDGAGPSGDVELDPTDDYEIRALDVETGKLRPRAPVASGSRDPLLAFTQTPRHPGNLLARNGEIGRSAEGRSIGMRQSGDPALDGEVLVFGCIHGDECAGSEVRPSSPVSAGCPDPRSDVYVVPNLDPDGSALGSRLNGRGVDLNRNFPSDWRPIGNRGDPQYSGPRPFSEPETRLAARVIRALAPEVTIWFHQYRGPRPFVRAWGQSAPAAREFARLAKLPFRLLPWPDGTAPNWQNHRFPGTASFVVELPPGPLARGLGTRLDDSLVRLGRKVSKD